MIQETTQAFIEALSIPKSCELNKPVFKKLFLESGVLDVADKAALKDDVDKVRWLYTLKPATINIPPYADGERDYPEIAILQVELISPKRFKRIAGFMQKSIPYPLIIIFTQQNSVCISLADKRVNQSDKQKWVVEDALHTDWIALDKANDTQKQFIDDCNINKFSYANFHRFYKSLSERVIALNCAEHSGRYELEIMDNEPGAVHADRLACLRDIEKLTAQKSELANRLKGEKQMAKKIELNTEIRRIAARIEDIKGKI